MHEEINDVIKLYGALTGRDVIPKNTPPQKTYQYRYAAKFAKKYKNVPWEIKKKIIYYAVEYAKECDNKSVYTRGLWILTKSNIIDIAYERAKEEDDLKDLDLTKLKNSYNFVKEHNNDLLKSEDGGFANIVMWYENKKISLTYLAMSESCKKAYNKLDDIDKNILPNKQDIINRRIKCLIDHDYRDDIKKILGSDYIKIIK